MSDRHSCRVYLPPVFSPRILNCNCRRGGNVAITSTSGIKTAASPVFHCLARNRHVTSLNTFVPYHSNFISACVCIHYMINIVCFTEYILKWLFEDDEFGSYRRQRATECVFKGNGRVTHYFKKVVRHRNRNNS